VVTIYVRGHVILRDNRSYFYINTSRIMCAVPRKAVFCRILILCFPGTLFRYFPSYSKSVRDVPIIIGITFVLTSHIHCICIVTPSQFTISRLFSVKYMSHKPAISINRHFPFSSSRILMYYYYYVTFHYLLPIFHVFFLLLFANFFVYVCSLRNLALWLLRHE